MKFKLGLALVGILVFASLAYAAIPDSINFQGKLRDSNGSIISGNYDMTFRIYDDSTFGKRIWVEDQSLVSVNVGLFDVRLGSSNPLNFTFNDSLWLSIEVNNDGEMSPRQRLLPSAYAYHSKSAENLTSDGNSYIITQGVTAVTIDSSGVDILGNLTLGEKVLFSFGNFIESISSNVINISSDLKAHNLNLTGNLTMGNGTIAWNYTAAQFIFFNGTEWSVLGSGDTSVSGTTESQLYGKNESDGNWIGLSLNPQGILKMEVNNTGIGGTTFDASDLWNDIHVNSTDQLNLWRDVYSNSTERIADNTTLTAMINERDPNANITGGGSQNYLAKFSDALTLKNSIVYDTGAFVGIGTAVPTHELTVQGSANITGALWVNGEAVTTSTSENSNVTSEGTANYITKFINATQIGNSVIYELSNKIGIGKINPLAILDIEKSAVGDNELNVSGTLVVNGTSEEVTVKGTILGSVDHGIKVYTSNGTFTQGTDCPEYVNIIEVALLGAGGGGGGGSAYGGSGGGAGGYSKKIITLSEGEAVTVTVGDKGIGGIGSNAGTAGSNSSFGSYFYASGGAGGTSGQSQLGGVGGNGFGGDLNIEGGIGGPSGTEWESELPFGGAAPVYGYSIVNYRNLQKTVNATGYGNGGPGCHTNGATEPYWGGNGANGIVIVEW